jgi:hypothetical protein
MTERSERRIFGLRARPATMVLGGLIALKLVLLFVFAWYGRFVMDEFGQLGYAKYLGNGLFDSIWPPKAVGATAFYKLAHLVGWDATSILLIGRLQTAALACATLGVVYGCARALGQDRSRALLILLIILCFSNFIERIFRTIAEPLALFFAAAALLTVLRGRAEEARTVVVAGILSGLSFLATQKAVYFNLALGLALVADAALARRYGEAVKRGAWLVMGWTLPILAYCLAFGGADPLAIAKNLAFGPIEVATTGADAYGSLRVYVRQTLTRNSLLYIFCFAGMGLALLRFRLLDERQRIALVFAAVITALVFAHDQPWPYVFIMALPFMALWSLELFDRLAAEQRYVRLAWLALAMAVAATFSRNLTYLLIDNRAQLELVARAESLLTPRDLYFDGVGMIPNRSEPGTLWLDRKYVLKTRRERDRSEAYRLLANSPPKVILWSYRMDGIAPVIYPLLRDSYVRIAPNLRIAGRRLEPGVPVTFVVPLAGKYALYSATGMRLQGEMDIDGATYASPITLAPGSRTVTLRTGPAALLLPEGRYGGQLAAGDDNDELFAHVYY